MAQDQTPHLEPIYATIADIRDRLAACRDCAQRREIIERWLFGQRVKAGLTGFSPPPAYPRDMSVLMKEK